MLFETKRSFRQNYFYTQSDRDLKFVGHAHMSYEFVTVTEGKLACSVYDRTFELVPGKAMLIMPNHVHRYETVGSSRSFLCIFSPDFIRDFHEDIKSESYVYSLFDWTDRGEIAALSAGGTDKYMRRAVLYSICSYARPFLSHIDKNATGRGFSSWEYLEEKLLEYIQENYDKDISLRRIAEEFGYNYSYVSERFNKVFGCGFSQFVNLLRVEDAAQMLVSTDYSIAKISVYCGFNSIRNLNLQFSLHYGMSPSEYRKSKRK